MLNLYYATLYYFFQPALAAAVLMGFDSFIVTQMNLFPKLVKRIVYMEKCHLVEIRTLYEKLEDYKHAVIGGIINIYLFYA